MAKKAIILDPVIRDLIDCLVNYSEYLETPPPGFELLPESEIEPTTYHFVVRTPEQKRDAILALLWGQYKEKGTGKAGNKSFKECDTELMWQMREEKEKTGETMEALLKKYADLSVVK